MSKQDKLTYLSIALSLVILGLMAVNFGWV